MSRKNRAFALAVATAALVGVSAPVAHAAGPNNTSGFNNDSPMSGHLCQRTPRGRNCTLIRGPTGWDVFGTACSQVRWQLPPMTSRSP